jgi:hypothetical protein
MKQTIRFALLSVLSAAVLLPACAQVVPSATGSRASLVVGGFASAGQPDYAGATNSSGQAIASTSPYRLYGMGAYVDYRMSRWVQLEGEARWLNKNQYLGINENSYSIGLREPIRTFGRFTPYGKALIGLGSGSFLTGHAAMYTVGGGVDYRLNKRFNVRAFDFEYQQWNVTPTLHPYTASVGLSYRIF